MAIAVSRLRAMGLAKESTPGTAVTTPTRYLNGVPPESFTPMIEPLPSKGIEALANQYPKITQGPGTLNGMKIKLEVEPDNIGEILQAIFGADSYTAAGASNFVVWAGINDAIDFTMSAVHYHCVIPQGIYAAAAIETAIATAMNAANSNTFVSTISATKFVISGTSNFSLDWSTGTQAGHNAAALLGYAKTDTSGSTNTYTAGSVPAYTTGSLHKFVRQQVSQLPTYTWWFDKALLYPLFAGCMADKLELDIKAKGIVESSVDWLGLVYDGADGITESTAFSALRPFVWANASVNIDGAIKLGYDNFKLSLSNNGKADHALNNSIWPYTYYSDGFTPDVSAELFFEDTTQYAKFLAGTTAHLNVMLSVVQGGVTYQMIIDIPNWYYKSANLYIPSNGPLKIPFTGMAQYNAALGYDVQILLVNDLASQY